MDSLLLAANRVLVTDDPNEDDTPLADADPPEEWVESIAAAEGIPPEAVVERLVSSYWTLTEVSEMLSGTEGDVGLAAAGDVEPGPRGMDGDKNEAPTAEDDGEAPTVEDIEELRERLDRLEEELHAQRESRTDIETDLGELTQRLDAIEAQFRDRHASLESRIDAELEYLETILGYLIDTTDDLDRDLSSILQGWTTVRDNQEERERLADLKRTASQLGVRSAECGHCGYSLDLGVLPTADCPACGREFVDIESATGWFGMGTDTLVTAGETAIETNDAEGGRQDSGDAEGGLFDW